jgi:DNA-binding CsgD family transcriptional regulator
MDLDAAREAAGAAREAARAAGNAAGLIDAAGRLGLVKVVAGDVEAGLTAIAGAAREARDAGFEDVGVTAYRDAAMMAARVMDYRSAEVSLREGMRYADAIEQSHCRHLMGATSALVDWVTGRWDNAIAVGEQELVDRGCNRGAIGAEVALGYVALGRGEFDQARVLLRNAKAAGDTSGAVELILPALWGLAETEVMADQPGVAVDMCAAAFELATRVGERALFAPFAVTGVRAMLAAGRPDAAERWATGVAEFLEPWAAVVRPALDHANGLVRLASGSTGIAREALEAAVTGWEARGRVWESTWARVDLASGLLRSNRYADAAGLLATARDEATRLESAPLIARINQLSDIANRHGSFDEPWRPLTTREFEVARLIADGLTNAEIAGELSIAPKTASAHVEHILAKLGVARRAEIATWVATVARPAAEPAASRQGVIAAR